jgi:GAF domain-containing protein
MDLAAAIAAYRHCRNPVVTVSVDSVRFLHPVKVGEVMMLEAVVTRAFKSSMEVEVGVHSEDLVTGELVKTCSAFLTFVAIDKQGRPTSISPLIPETDDEIRRFNGALSRREQRLQLSAQEELRIQHHGKSEVYEDLLKDIEGSLSREVDPMIWMAGLSSLIHWKTGFSWVGFYRVQGDELLIGPYQGSFGCIRIPFGKGVCGACATRGETVIVPDVQAFPGHIACDPRSKSEIVVPVIDDSGQLRAVLDIDSSELDTFDEVDQRYLERIAGRMKGLKWNRIC